MTGPKREELYLRVQNALAGEPTGLVLGVLLDSVAMAIGFAATDMENVDQMLATLPDDLRKQIVVNWDYLCSLRGSPSIQASRA